MTSHTHQCNYSIQTAGFCLQSRHNNHGKGEDDVQECRTGEKHNIIITYFVIRLIYTIMYTRT